MQSLPTNHKHGFVHAITSDDNRMSFETNWQL